MPAMTAQAIFTPPSNAGSRRFAGAVGVHIGGTACRAAADAGPDHVIRATLHPGGVSAICEAIKAAVLAVEPSPRFVTIATPGNVNRTTGTVAGAANLGPEWAGIVPLRELLAARLGCEVEIRNDADASLEVERRRGALMGVNDVALITLGTGVGVALLADGREQPTELGHCVLQFGGPPYGQRPHCGCFESYLGGWALPLRYRERHPEFTGTAAREIPDDAAFWTECGARLVELVVMLCLLGKRLEVVSLVGQVALARAKYLVPPVRQRVAQESLTLATALRSVRVTPLGDAVSVLGALLIARNQLYPFSTQ